MTATPDRADLRAPRWRGHAEAARVSEILRKEAVGGALLVVAAVVDIVWANSSASEGYFALRDFRFGYEPWHLELSLGAWAADGLLAIFFFLVGLELKRELVAGDLRRFSTAVVPVTAGDRTLKDAVNEALRDWAASFEDTHYLLGTAAGPHPFPLMVRQFQRVIGREARAQILEIEGRLPDAVVACVGGGSNAIGLFTDFVPDDEVRLVGVEAAGKGLHGREHGATLLRGRPGVLHGAATYVLQDADGQIEESWSVSAGLDYPAVGPQHAFLKDSGRADYVGATDEEALAAFATLARREGIVCAFESAHALAHALKLAEEADEETVLIVNISGRGDKDMEQARRLMALG